MNAFATRLTQITMVAATLAAGLMVLPVHAAERAGVKVVQLQPVVVVAKRIRVVELPRVVVTAKRLTPGATLLAQRSQCVAPVARV
jgi:hypothetical protein